MFDTKLKKLTDFIKEKNLTVSTAESCTGGLLSSRFTDISGSSDFIKLNFVTYANEAKEQVLGVPKEILEKSGAVSEECAYYMAKGLSEKTGCDISVCTTGIAGPTGGTKEKPVGLVFIGVFYSGEIFVKKYILPKFLPRKIMKYLFSQCAISTTFDFININK